MPPLARPIVTADGRSHTPRASIAADRALLLETARAPARVHSDSLAAVPDVPWPLGDRPNQRACSAKCRAALSRGRRESARKEGEQQLAELLRLALRSVEDR